MALNNAYYHRISTYQIENMLILFSEKDIIIIMIIVYDFADVVRGLHIRHNIVYDLIHNVLYVEMNND